MSTKYVVHRYSAQIDTYECTKETAAYVELKSLYSDNSLFRKKKDGDVFDTWEEAHAELTRRADAHLNAARRQLEQAQGWAGNVRGMKPPAAEGEGQP